MLDFEKYLEKFIRNVQLGRLDMAVLRDKFIKGGLYKLPEENKPEEIHLVGLYSDTLEARQSVEFNRCKTCEAKDGRAGNLINGECLNCYDTRRTGEICIHTNLRRTDEEIEKTFGILPLEKY